MQHELFYFFGVTAEQQRGFVNTLLWGFLSVCKHHARPTQAKKKIYFNYFFIDCLGQFIENS